MATAHVLVVDDEEELRDVVCTLLRRAGHQATGAGDGRVVEPRQRGVEHDEVREVEFADSSRVRVAGRPLPLMPLEYRLLRCLVRHAGQVLSRDQLLELVWDQPFGGPSHQVKVCVGDLRRKLAAQTDPAPIEPVRGFGYRHRAA